MNNLIELNHNNSKFFKKLRNYGVDDLNGICSECPLNSECLGGCRLNPYIKNKSIVGSNTLCQEFYNKARKGKLELDTFPSGILTIKNYGGSKKC
ncbi:hypothetical protein NRK67_10515 [Fusobacteria bacterium ZRK30]|nr:hypothetical protein NRK67_10515 [Fusobacteria bacterium ZRK30]